MTLSTAPRSEPPPHASNRPRELRRADGERLQRQLAASASGWVGGAEDWADKPRSRPAAISRCKRAIACLQEIEGKASKFERRVWAEGSRFNWAIRRAEKQG